MKAAYGKLLEATSRVAGQAKRFSAEIAGKLEQGHQALQKAKRQQTTGREASVCSKPFHQKRETQEGAEDALVQRRSEVADRLRGTHQRSQTAAWVEPVPLQRYPRNETLVGLGVIADNMINIGLHLAAKR